MKTDCNLAISSFLDDLRTILQREASISLEDPAAAKASWTTLPESCLPAAILRPNSVAEVQAIVKAAGRHNVPLYPVSTGNNWGYGCSQPVTENCVLLDLGEMNKVLEVNREMAYAVIEPGVTQGQLAAHLTAAGIPLMIDPTGAGPAAGLLGNALERGYGLGLYGDHFGSLCGMEVVLANGELLKTEFGRFENSRARHIYKWGLGPFVDGLFSQSNFGIVVRIGVWLQPVPAHLEVCLAQVNSDEDAFALADKVRILHLEQSIRTRANFLSQGRLLSLFEQSPHPTRPLSEEEVRSLADYYGIGRWNVMFALFGTRDQTAAAKKRISRLIRPHCSRLIFASERRIKLLRSIGAAIRLRRLTELATMLRLIMSIFKGAPTIGALRLAYWRNQSAKPPQENPNPSRDRCGVIWFAPIVPLSSSGMRDFIALAAPICRSNGFDFAPTFTTVADRAFDCTIPILYSKDDPEQCAHALNCYNQLASSAAAAGFVPYRLGIQSMNQFFDPDDPYTRFVSTLKAAIDPQRILAPGRYELK